MFDCDELFGVLCCFMFCIVVGFSTFFFFFSSRRRHTRCALVTGVQTCALPISRERTHATVARINRETDLLSAAHLTCVDASKAEIEEIARAYWDAGVRHIVALRGDPPEAGRGFTPHPEGYATAAELVGGLKRIAPFDISVAAYPETHPEALSSQADLENLKRKLDAGASRAITQFFFSPDTFFRFRDKAAAAGIDAEIVPGILPVSNVAQTRKFAAMCGAAIPPWMDRLFEDRKSTRLNSSH